MAVSLALRHHGSSDSDFPKCNLVKKSYLNLCRAGADGIDSDRHNLAYINLLYTFEKKINLLSSNTSFMHTVMIPRYNSVLMQKSMTAIGLGLRNSKIGALLFRFFGSFYSPAFPTTSLS